MLKAITSHLMFGTIPAPSFLFFLATRAANRITPDAEATWAESRPGKLMCQEAGGCIMWTLGPNIWYTIQLGNPKLCIFKQRVCNITTWWVIPCQQQTHMMLGWILFRGRKYNMKNQWSVAFIKMLSKRYQSCMYEIPLWYVWKMYAMILNSGRPSLQLELCSQPAPGGKDREGKDLLGIVA